MLKYIAGGASVAIAGAIGGAITWFISGYVAVSGVELDKAKFDHELDKDKLQIVEFIDTHKPQLAVIILDYYEDRLRPNSLLSSSDETDDPALALIDALQAYVATTQQDLAPTPPKGSPSAVGGKVAELSAKSIRDQFFSAARRNFAEELVGLYEVGTVEEKTSIIEELTGSIIAKDEDARRRYRVNLYIALTLSLLPPVPPENREKVTSALQALRDSDEYKKDSTFRLNVDNATIKQSVKPDS